MKYRAGRCNHFTGIQHERCCVGLRYADVRGSDGRLPCLSPPAVSFAPTAACDKIRLPTLDEITQGEKEMEEALEDLRLGRSHCCKAPLDERSVITSGRHKGHGARYCSKCGRVAFLV